MIENVCMCPRVSAWCLYLRTYRTHTHFAMRTSMHNVVVLCVAAVMADGVLVRLGSTLSPGLSVAESSIRVS